MKFPTENEIPEKGYYYHYKHDPSLSVNNYAYELIDVGVHSEDDCRPIDANMAVYKPLYKESGVYQHGKVLILRPLEMWLGEVVKNGKTVKRFEKISNEKIISELNKIKKEMYGAE